MLLLQNDSPQPDFFLLPVCVKLPWHAWQAWHPWQALAELSAGPCFSWLKMAPSSCFSFDCPNNLIPSPWWREMRARRRLLRTSSHLAGKGSNQEHLAQPSFGRPKTSRYRAVEREVFRLPRLAGEAKGRRRSCVRVVIRLHVYHHDPARRASEPACQHTVPEL